MFLILTCVLLVGSVHGAMNITANYSFASYFLVNQVTTQIRIATIAVAFRTTKHNGVLFYMSTDDTFVTVELYYSSLRVAGNSSGSSNRRPVEFVVGSGLSDGKIHQLELVFPYDYNSCLVLIDRASHYYSDGNIFNGFKNIFINLQLKFMLGNLPNIVQSDMYQSRTSSNFIGCIEYVIISGKSLFDNPIYTGALPNCTYDVPIQYTFKVSDAYFMVYRKFFEKDFVLQFDMVTYNDYSVIIKHSVFYYTLILSVFQGRMRVTVEGNGTVLIDMINPIIKVTDGAWHTILLRVPSKYSTVQDLVLSVSGDVIRENMPVIFDIGHEIKFGGVNFQGCVRNIMVDGASYELNDYVPRVNVTINDMYSRNNGTEVRAYDGCNFTYICKPNPCLNNGVCNSIPEAPYFTCTCMGIYSGKYCENPGAFFSCADAHKNNFRVNGWQLIDVDGVNTLPAVMVECFEMDSANYRFAATYIRPLQPLQEFNLGKNTAVIEYNASLATMVNLIALSTDCQQTVYYRCRRSHILKYNTVSSANFTNSSMVVEPLVSWMGGDGLVHDYWNSKGVWGSCDCGLPNAPRPCSTTDPSLKCYCDEEATSLNNTGSKLDMAIFTIKKHLPVLSIFASNISAVQGRTATVEVGPLICRGFGNMLEGVTFMENYAYMEILEFPMRSYVQLNFDFRTNEARHNIMIALNSRFGNGFVVITLESPTTMSCRYTKVYEIDPITGAVKTKVYTLKTTIPSPAENNQSRYLDDNYFHAVAFELTSTYIFMAIDDVAITRKTFEPMSGQYVSANYNMQRVFLGGSPYDPFSGFKGMFRNFFMSGIVIDVAGAAAKAGSSVVRPGQQGACMVDKANASVWFASYNSQYMKMIGGFPNLCNTGECWENYNFYHCNCSISPFYGRNCERERGIVTAAGSGAKFALNYIFTDPVDAQQLTITIGFTTTDINAALFLIQSSQQNVFIYAQIINSTIQLILNSNPQIEYDFYTINDNLNSNASTNVSDGRFHVLQVYVNIASVQMVVDGVQRDVVALQPATNVKSYSQLKQFYVGGWEYLNYLSPQVDTLSSNVPVSSMNISGPFTGCISGAKAVIRKANEYVGTVYDPIFLYYKRSQNVMIGNVAEGKCGTKFLSFPYAQLMPFPPNMIPGGTNKKQIKIPLGQNWGATIIALCVHLCIIGLLLGSILFGRMLRNRGINKTRNNYYGGETDRLLDTTDDESS